MFRICWFKALLKPFVSTTLLDCLSELITIQTMSIYVPRYDTVFGIYKRLCSDVIDGLKQYWMSSLADRVGEPRWELNRGDQLGASDDNFFAHPIEDEYASRLELASALRIRSLNILHTENLGTSRVTGKTWNSCSLGAPNTVNECSTYRHCLH
jgi:hypothetical protein